MEPVTTAALISALGGVTGGILSKQAEREQALEQMKYQALMKAIQDQASAYDKAAQGQQAAYQNMMAAYRG